MKALFLTCVVAIIAVMLASRACIRRAGGTRTSHADGILWLPAIAGIGGLVMVYDIMHDRDLAARLAMEREVVSINTCPAPAPGLSDTIALIVNAPACVQPRVEDCFRHQERSTSLRDRHHKDKIAEVR